MNTRNFFILFLGLYMLNIIHLQAKNQTFHGLQFSTIPTIWDEAIPLGNGIIGNLIWEKDGNLRLALDRADLWDLRPVKEFGSPSYSYVMRLSATKIFLKFAL